MPNVQTYFSLLSYPYLSTLNTYSWYLLIVETRHNISIYHTSLSFLMLHEPFRYDRVVRCLMFGKTSSFDTLANVKHETRFALA